MFWSSTCSCRCWCPQSAGAGDSSDVSATVRRRRWWVFRLDSSDTRWIGFSRRQSSSIDIWGWCRFPPELRRSVYLQLPRLMTLFIAVHETNKVKEMTLWIRCRRFISHYNKCSCTVYIKDHYKSEKWISELESSNMRAFYDQCHAFIAPWDTLTVMHGEMGLDLNNWRVT